MGLGHKKKGDLASIYYRTGALHCCAGIICWRSEESILLLVDKPCACLYFLPGGLYFFDNMYECRKNLSLVADHQLHILPGSNCGVLHSLLRDDVDRAKSHGRHKRFQANEIIYV